LIRNALVDSGIEAFVTEDVSTVGVWMLGLLPEIHKPQVWVERADMLRTKPILDDYERHESERRATQVAKLANEPTIEAMCEECGKSVAFPAVQRGSIQECPHCGEHMDVGDTDSYDDWGWRGADNAEET
jgi:uncharacterized protein YlaI